jgi:ABC-type dipeptide/oligopeptide/nickel transport system permease component
MLLVFTIITCMCFVLIRMLPPLPLDMQSPHTTVVMARREAMGYNKPYMVQFAI